MTDAPRPSPGQESVWEEIFGPGGRLSAVLPGYEERPGQAKMAAAVAEILREGGELLVEAGTGTGKTLAYLAPAALCGTRIVISTGTKTLQDQILHKDLPLLEALLGKSLRACVMKGRPNYLCRRRYQAFLNAPTFRTQKEDRLFEEINKWVETSEAGDIAELDEIPEDYGPWREVSSTSETCQGPKCPLYETSFTTKMRAVAAASDIIIVNHHLFFSDLALRLGGRGEHFPGRVLPRYHAVIFDEAHILEDVATEYFGVTLSRGRFEEVARDMLRELAGKRDDRLTGNLARLARATDAFFEAISPEVVEPLRETEAGGRRRLRPENISPSLEETKEGLNGVLITLSNQLSRKQEEGFLAGARRCREISDDLSFILEMKDPEYISWVQSRGKSFALSASPIHVAGLLQTELFDRLKSVVLTSATLRSGESFDYIRGRLGLRQPADLLIHSPFDHPRQGVLFLPQDLPYPDSPRFVEAICPVIESVLEISRGRAFVLFTSYRNMRAAHARLKQKLPYRIFLQGERPKSLLLEDFRSGTSSVLFGTSSFWQGVDVQGKALSCVIVDKLPFASPADPLVEARVEALSADGEDPFLSYQVPQAVISLKQGLGRLIRSRKDRGILAVLDGRISSRPYGQLFLKSLPPWPVVRTIDELRERAALPKAGSSA